MCKLLVCQRNGNQRLTSSSIHAWSTFVFVGTCVVSGALFAKTPTTPNALPAKDHWAYAPLRKIAPPDMSGNKWSGWARTPIDRFVLAKLDEHGMHPSMPADKLTLLRRVYFDLIGMPPMPDEIAAFLTDDSPDAYERIVDSLLASPHYGERWARHWMDVVHFAETHGHDEDAAREHAWPYRDYLIRSFNMDKPYTQFVQEQVAGDVLFPDDLTAMKGTGLLAAGPWDLSSLMNVNSDSDRLIGQYLDRDDIVNTVMSTFSSTSVQCARCHAHKFDPISQEDYYSLQAVFAGIDKADRPYDVDPIVRQKRIALEERTREVQKQLSASDSALLDPTLLNEVAAWEKQLHRQAANWQVLQPTESDSAEGANLTTLPDGSVLSGGKRPDTDTYTILAHSDLAEIKGIRLEVLTDESLPQNGPGRQDSNGGFLINELVVTAGDNAPKNDANNPESDANKVESGERQVSAARGDGVTPQAIQLVDSQADFSEESHPISHLVDGKDATVWGILPEVGKPHRAVFTLAKPLVSSQGRTTLKFELKQLAGAGYLVGRFRLSVTDAAPPYGSSAYPESTLQILATALNQRNDTQRRELSAFLISLRCQTELATLPAFQYFYCGTNKFKVGGHFRPVEKPRTVNILARGDIKNPGATASPGTLALLPDLPSRFELAEPDMEGKRRAALAKWLSDPRNVLTWRSIVNRVWHYHFGLGIVDTPNEFGHLGGQPSHPELLDWLAVTFRDGGGSLKNLHRQIVTSAVYRQSSDYNSPFAEVDGNNRYLWRMSRRRLDAEQIRDALLRISGKLDTTMGGPSVKQFIQSPGPFVTPSLDYTGFDPNDPANHRRSVYRFIYRTVPDPFMEALDCPDASMLAPQRNESLTAIQALSMVNDKFIVRMSDLIAQRAKLASEDLGVQLVETYLLVLGRRPDEQEKMAVVRYAEKHGLANACRYIVNGNEFMFVD